MLMKIKKSTLMSLWIFLMMHSGSLTAQQAYTLRAAIDTALNRNLGIRIERNNLKIDENNATLGNAGMLPRIDVNGNVNRSQNDIHQEYADGSQLDNKNIQSDNYGGNVVLTWTLFNGTRMFADYHRLKLKEQVGEVNLKQQVISTVSAVSGVYYALVRAEKNIENINANLSLYQERVKIAEEKLNVGRAAKTELLQAQVDLNEQITSLYSAQANLRSSKIQLNELLLFPPDDTTIVASDSLRPLELASYAELLEGIEKNNPDLREYLLLQEVAKQELKAQKAYSYPQLDLNAGYYSNNTSTEGGFFRENKTTGPQAGLTFKWNLFNGNVQNRQIQNSRIMEENARLTTEQLRNAIQSSFANTWQQYQAAIIIWKKEQESNALADENLTIVGERFRLNQGDVIELREAQRSKENASDRLLNAAYLAKIAETDLLALAGILVK
ncbi:TolC family protein [soil metagenome]